MHYCEAAGVKYPCCYNVLHEPSGGRGKLTDRNTVIPNRAAQMLSLVSNSNQLLNPAQTDVLPCEYLSLDAMERWIILGYMLIPQTLQKPQALDCWTQALQTGWAITLFR